MHSKKRKCAFSLAEALITLLIVCLITLASIPILTKKKRDITNVEHGMFACYWNGDKLVAKYSRKGAVTDGITKYDNVEGRWGCVFNPPSDAKNFVVTIVGGGGGGGGFGYEHNSNGAWIDSNKEYYINGYTYEKSGCSGWSKDTSSCAKVADDPEAMLGVYGGEFVRKSYTMSNSERDYVRAYFYSGAPGEAAINPQFLKNTSFYSHGTRRSWGYDYTDCKRGASNSWCKNRKYSTYTAMFNLDPSNESLYGSGGRGDQDGSKGAKSGKNGVGSIKWVQSYSGLGGKAGKVLQLPFAQLPANTLAFPGKGGKGGYISRSIWGYIESPRSGQSSYLKNYAEVLPGITSGPVHIISSTGGDPSNYYDTKASGVTVVGGPGELANINPVTKVVGGAGGYTFIADNGYVDNSSLNGHTRPMFKNGAAVSDFKNLIGAGAGGGGGAANGKDLGDGGDGSSGIVFIQW